MIMGVTVLPLPQLGRVVPPEDSLLIRFGCESKYFLFACDSPAKASFKNCSDFAIFLSSFYFIIGIESLNVSYSCILDTGRKIQYGCRRFRILPVPFLAN